MKNAIVKIRVSEAEKIRLETFAREAGRTISDVLRSAIDETMQGQVAGHQRRERIAKLRRSTNLMLAAFEAKPIDVPMLKGIAAQVRNAASKVLA
jgi:hypothetical protein